MPEEFQFKRAAAKPKKINAIKPEEDIRVQIFGTVVDFSDSSVIIDDGEATAELAIGEKTAFAGELRNGMLLRAFCRVIPIDYNYSLQAEILQDMSGIDIDLYKKLME